MRAQGAKPYYHEQTDEALDSWLNAEKRTVGDLLRDFAQPEWCCYPDALAMAMGCWSLVDKDLRKKISKRYCAGCDCARHYVGKYRNLNYRTRRHHTTDGTDEAHERLIAYRRRCPQVGRKA